MKILNQKKKLDKRVKVLMKNNKLNNKKIKKEVKRNNFNSISCNHRSFINTFSSSNRAKCRR